MTELMTSAFARYGLSVTVTHGAAATQTKAFLQPLRRESNDEPFNMAPLGAVEERCWRYLGPSNVAIAIGDTVTNGTESYLVRSCAAVYAGSEVAYYWAVLHPKEAAAT